MFTCETDIHVDYPDGTTSEIVHLHNGADDQGAGLMDQVCQIHASSHVFTNQKPFIVGHSETPPERVYHLATLNLVNVLRLIEHPPRFLHG